jgi:hypothetical protein
MKARKPAALLGLVLMAVLAWTSLPVRAGLAIRGVQVGMTRSQVEQVLGTPGRDLADPGWRTYPLAAPETVAVKFSRDRAAIVEGSSLEREGQAVLSGAELLRQFGPPAQVQGRGGSFEVWVYPRLRLIVVMAQGQQPWRYILGCSDPSQKR